VKLTRYNDLTQKGKIVRGSWEINDQHEIRYRKEGSKEDVTLKARILDVEPSSLLLTVTEKQTNQRIVTSIVKLKGRWQTDAKNRITFEVTRQFGRSDVLTFKGSWKVGKSHEIIYTYKRTHLKTRKKTEHRLVFKGYWDISEKNRLTYLFEGQSNSFFRFRGTFQTKSILAKKGEIRYQVGVEVQGKRRVQRIVLFGKWKLSRKLDLSFEIQYSKGRKRAIVFAGSYQLDEKHRIHVKLKNTEDKGLGVEVVFTRDIFDGQGQAFVRLVKSLQDTRFEGGMQLKW